MTKITRRNFVSSTSCAAYMLGIAAAAPVMTRKVFASTWDRKVIASEKWGRIEEVAENCWAVISTPFETKDYTTVSNGGIIAGKDRVLVVESFMQEQGAGWVAQQAKKITGRWPTDVVVTHYHGDHSSGTNGYFTDGEKPNFWLTEETSKGIRQVVADKNKRAAAGKEVTVPPSKTLNKKKPTIVDLGGRKVKITPLSGHTKSDVTIELIEPNVVFCGDLFFNRIIPNYADAAPATLNKNVAAIELEKESTIIPGHGPVASKADFEVYRKFLKFVQAEAETSFKAGKSADRAAKEFQLKGEFKDWYIFAPTVVPRAMNAWYRELRK